jgi:hypothetical protein
MCHYYSIINDIVCYIDICVQSKVVYKLCGESEKVKLGILKVTLSILLIMVIVLLGCKNDSLLNYRRVKADYVGGKVKKIVSNIGAKNGVYLYIDDKKTMYLLLKDLLVAEGNEAPYFSNVSIEPKGDVLNISYNEKYTKDYINKKIDNKLMYRIRLNKKFNTIKLFRNGKEIHFNNVYL